MRHRLKSMKAVLFLVVVAVLALAGTAFACTPKPEKFALDSPAARPGESVTVAGATFPLAEVTIHWNSVDDAVLAETTAEPVTGDFSETFEVPADAEPGVAYVVASVGDRGGMTRAALEVTGSEQATASQEVWTLAQDPALSDATTSGLSASPPLVAGMAMLTVGLVGLSAGATAASLQRRTAAAPAHRP